ncbi:uncharacterized protein LOC135835490 [Planococcus citri]|uniref:uncharacterized protein LOC135835490 n=1 Tax=Planococcus citri TaxID=170843 RepID=UPI0031F8EE05
MNPFKFFNRRHLLLYFMSIVDRVLQSLAQSDATIITQTQTSILWSLAPCQSAFWVPNIPTAFNQNWITYQYEGNPLSKFDECVFTLESDPNTRIEIVVAEVHLFGKEVNSNPPPCLELHDVKTDGSITLLKKECGRVLAGNEFEMFPTFTDTNVAVISTTIQYGSFQLRARAVPRNFGFPKVSSTPINRPAIDTSPTLTPGTNIIPSPTTSQPAVIDALPSVVTILPLPANSSLTVNSGGGGGSGESSNFFARPLG